MAATAAHADPPSVERYYSQTYNDCMNEAAGSTLPMRQCMGDEHDAWDKQLNQVYQALMTRRAEPAKVQLRDDERAWLKRTKSQCDHAGDDEAGGTLQGVEIDQCYLDETIRRTLYLRGLH
ncbi:MAG TPA: lysozyme inhibitor LprI family protein [Caulobacteraceae bacterium]|nr:lysozyme inhibitor LprI family protein [Caulobacteraceae bacterium]